MMDEDEDEDETTPSELKQSKHLKHRGAWWAAVDGVAQTQLRTL